MTRLDKIILLYVILLNNSLKINCPKLFIVQIVNYYDNVALEHFMTILNNLSFMTLRVFFL